MMLAQLQFVKDGFDPASGVESVLLKEAEAQDKSFGFLETSALRIEIFEGMSMESQIQFLVDGALTLDITEPMLDSITDEWADGDVEGLGTIISNPDIAGGSEFYDGLFVRRNKHWVPQIEAMLDEPGTFMVAVGAGHLAGPDSVIKMLEDNGHTLTRTQ